MLSDRTEIDNVLERGREVLENRPELANMSLKDVIDELYDIIHERWGVAAWLVVNSIEKWDLMCLIEQLASVESGLLTYEYAGYLLQSKYDVDLVNLLIMADEQGKFENIAKYVSSNLRFMPEVKQQNIEPLLHMLEKHIDSGDYFGIVSNYAIGIANCRAYKFVADCIGEINSKPQYDLMRQLRRDYWSYIMLRNNIIGDAILKPPKQKRRYKIWHQSFNGTKASVWCIPYTMEIRRNKSGKPIIPMKPPSGERNNWT